MDVAKLQFSIDSTQARDARRDLEEMRRASVDAASQAAELSRGWERGSPVAAAFREQLRGNAAEARDLTSTIDGLVDRFGRLARAQQDGLATLREVQTVFTELEATGRMFGTNASGLETFNRASRQLALDAGQSVTALRAMTAALEGLSAQGQAARGVLENYGVRVEGRSPSEAGTVLREFQSQARRFAPDPLRRQELAMFGIDSPEAVRAFEFPEYRSIESRAGEARRAELGADVSRMRERRLYNEREADTRAARLADMEKEWGARESGVPAWLNAIPGVGSIIQGIDRATTSDAERLRALEARAIEGAARGEQPYSGTMQGRLDAATGRASDAGLIYNPLRNPMAWAITRSFAPFAQMAGEYANSDAYAERSAVLDTRYRLDRETDTSPFGFASRIGDAGRRIRHFLGDSSFVRTVAEEMPEDRRPVNERLPEYQQGTQNILRRGQLSPIEEARRNIYISAAREFGLGTDGWDRMRPEEIWNLRPGTPGVRQPAPIRDGATPPGLPEVMSPDGWSPDGIPANPTRPQGEIGQGGYWDGQRRAVEGRLYALDSVANQEFDRALQPMRDTRAAARRGMEETGTLAGGERAAYQAEAEARAKNSLFTTEQQQHRLRMEMAEFDDRRRLIAQQNVTVTEEQTRAVEAQTVAFRAAIAEGRTFAEAQGIAARAGLDTREGQSPAREGMAGAQARSMWVSAEADASFGRGRMDDSLREESRRVGAMRTGGADALAALNAELAKTAELAPLIAAAEKLRGEELERARARIGEISTQFDGQLERARALGSEMRLLQLRSDNAALQGNLRTEDGMLGADGTTAPRNIRIRRFIQDNAETAYSPAELRQFEGMTGSTRRDAMFQRLDEPRRAELRRRYELGEEGRLLDEEPMQVARNRIAEVSYGANPLNRIETARELARIRGEARGASPAEIRREVDLAGIEARVPIEQSTRQFFRDQASARETAEADLAWFRSGRDSRPGMPFWAPTADGRIPNRGLDGGEPVPVERQEPMPRTREAAVTPPTPAVTPESAQAAAVRSSTEAVTTFTTSVREAAEALRTLSGARTPGGAPASPGASAEAPAAAPRERPAGSPAPTAPAPQWPGPVTPFPEPEAVRGSLVPPTRFDPVAETTRALGGDRMAARRAARTPGPFGPPVPPPPVPDAENPADRIQPMPPEPFGPPVPSRPASPLLEPLPAAPEAPVGIAPQRLAGPRVEARLRAIASEMGVPEEMAVLLARLESGGQHWKQNGEITTSRAGARGLLQLMPDTARELRVDPDDLEGNMRGGLRYFRDQLNTAGGNFYGAYAAYNAGPNRDSVRTFQATGDESRLPLETRNALARARRYAGEETVDRGTVPEPAAGLSTVQRADLGRGGNARPATIEEIRAVLYGNTDRREVAAGVNARINAGTLLPGERGNAEAADISTRATRALADFEKQVLETSLALAESERRIGAGSAYERGAQRAEASADIAADRMRGLASRLPEGDPRRAELMEAAGQQRPLARRRYDQNLREQSQLEDRQQQDQLSDEQFSRTRWWQSSWGLQRDLGMRREDRRLRDTYGDTMSEDERGRRVQQAGQLGEYSELNRVTAMARESFLGLGQDASQALGQIIMQGGKAKDVIASLLAQTAARGAQRGFGMLLSMGIDAVGGYLTGGPAGALAGAVSGASRGATGAGIALSGGSGTTASGIGVETLGPIAPTTVAAAQGAVIGPAGPLRHFAQGGVTDTPTYFGMGDGGRGLMGEAGPEAILPLTRLPNGNLGVQAGGGGGGGVTQQINVHVGGGGGGGSISAEDSRRMAEAVRQAAYRGAEEAIANNKRMGGMLNPVFGG
jgi:hypothetical protein